MIKLELKNSNEIKNVAWNFNRMILLGVPENMANFANETKQQQLKELGKVPKYNNAQILALMEAGSPINNIPSRKLLYPVINKYRKQIDSKLISFIKLFMSGKVKEADEVLEKLSLQVQAWAQLYFVRDNDWKPNAPSTVYSKNRRNHHKPYNAKTMPLIDTGSLRQSIKGVVVKNTTDIDKKLKLKG